MPKAGERRRGQLYGRRQGHKLRAGQQSALDERLPNLLAPEAGLIAPQWTEAWLEIGFGGGEHLLAQMAAHPAVGFIGAQPFVNGMASLLGKLPEADRQRLMLWDKDARLLLERLAPQSIDRAFLLFPDPWPKKRHWKRRFVSRETLELLHCVLKPGGSFRVATDIPDYARWTMIEIAAHGGFDWTAREASDWRMASQDHVETRYERKARGAGRQPVFLDFLRR